MPPDSELAHALAALSARVMAIEGALVSLAPDARKERARALSIFDRFEEEIFDRYLGLPVEETFLEILRRAFADVRKLLESKIDPDEGIAGSAQE